MMELSHRIQANRPIRHLWQTERQARPIQAIRAKESEQVHLKQTLSLALSSTIEVLFPPLFPVKECRQDLLKGIHGPQ